MLSVSEPGCIEPSLLKPVERRWNDWSPSVVGLLSAAAVSLVNQPPPHWHSYSLRVRAVSIGAGAAASAGRAAAHKSSHAWHTVGTSFRPPPLGQLTIFHLWTFPSIPLISGEMKHPHQVSTGARRAWKRSRDRCSGSITHAGGGKESRSAPCLWSRAPPVQSGLFGASANKNFST
jgi:hypothetical protein